MTEPKTRPTDASVPGFLSALPDPKRRADAERVCELMAEVSGEQPVLWGDSIVGFGSMRLVYADKSERDWPIVAFSPRKRELVLYLMDGFADRTELLERLGPHRTGVSCLYLRRLDAVDEGALRELLADSIAAERQRDAGAG